MTLSKIIYCGHRSGWRDHTLLERVRISLEWPWIELVRGDTDSYLYVFNFVWRKTSRTELLNGSPSR